jgi:hypothetical protein
MKNPTTLGGRPSYYNIAELNILQGQVNKTTAKLLPKKADITLKVIST